MSLQIIKGAEIYTFPTGFKLDTMPISKRAKVNAVAYSDVSANLGDKRYQPRYITITGKLYAASDGSFQSKWDDLVLALSWEDFYLRDGDWQIPISQVIKISPESDDGLRKRFEEIEIELLALHPFWIHKDSSSKQEVCTSMPQQFVVNNSGNYLVYPVISIVADANNYSMSLKNVTDNDAIFSYIDTGFQTGDELIVDCQEGMVELDDVNTIRYFEGQFLRLLPGNNTLEYDGDDATITITWYRRRI